MWVENKKHRWELNSRGEVDEFAFSERHHNGPVCVKCVGCDREFTCVKLVRIKFKTMKIPLR